MASFLNEASRVTLFCGAGCAGAHDAVVELAGKLKAPIVHAFRGKEFVEYENPYDVGMTGLVGFASGYAAMKNCDTLLLLGTDFPYRAFFPEHAKIAQIDVRPEALGNRCPLISVFSARSRTRSRRCCRRSSEKSDRSHLDDALAHYAKARKDLDALAESGPNSKIIHPQYVTRLVSELADDDAIFTCDVGTPIIWTARYLKVNGKRRIVGSFNHGSMANAMLQAIGAQAALSGAPSHLHVGRRRLQHDDGRFPHAVPGRLSDQDHRSQQRNAGLRRNGNEGQRLPRHRLRSKNPNFAAMAEAVGVQGIRVEKPQDLRGGDRSCTHATTGRRCSMS